MTQRNSALLRRLIGSLKKSCIGPRLGYALCFGNNKMNKVRLAWTIFKLNVVRALLRPLVRLHTWWILKDQREIEDKSIIDKSRKANRKKADIKEYIDDKT